MTEVQSKFDNVLDRLHILGASSDQVEWVRGEWDRLDEDTPEAEQEAEREQRRDALYRHNDAVLAQMINDGKAAEAQSEIEGSDTPLAARALSDHEAEVEAQAEADWETLALAIPTVLDAVGDNVEFAYRLYQLEQTADKPRKGLLEHLEKIAWPHGKPAGADEEAALQAAADDALEA
jgi:hypothetical protein